MTTKGTAVSVAGCIMVRYTSKKFGFDFDRDTKTPASFLNTTSWKAYQRFVENEVVNSTVCFFGCILRVIVGVCDLNQILDCWIHQGWSHINLKKRVTPGEMKSIKKFEKQNKYWLHKANQWWFTYIYNSSNQFWKR